ncbi:hypothetical protein RvY_19236 [Ramazzottius varieornatus]|uniref:Uncharacterized protein n=1 Tax=Ramazzottius varieornatus TaxID=947166 RepID=A0A1D1WC62_RAMVA|nr:hypothetical protein RvY_19236 [Ramazzottius varieornatus]
MTGEIASGKTEAPSSVRVFFVRKYYARAEELHFLACNLLLGKSTSTDNKLTFGRIELKAQRSADLHNGLEVPAYQFEVSTKRGIVKVPYIEGRLKRLGQVPGQKTEQQWP